MSSKSEAQHVTSTTGKGNVAAAKLARTAARKARRVMRSSHGVWSITDLTTLAKGGENARTLRSAKPWKEGTRQDKYAAKLAVRRERERIRKQQEEEDKKAAEQKDQQRKKNQ